MKFKISNVAAAMGFAVLSTMLAGKVFAVDEEAAKALARQNKCTQCHAIDKKKDGPAFKDVAVKYRGKKDAEERLINHITSGEKAKFEDGHEEEHKIVKTSPPKDTEQIRNLVQWVLAQ